MIKIAARKKSFIIICLAFDMLNNISSFYIGIIIDSSRIPIKLSNEIPAFIPSNAFINNIIHLALTTALL